MPPLSAACLAFNCLATYLLIFNLRVFLVIVIYKETVKKRCQKYQHNYPEEYGWRIIKIYHLMPPLYINTQKN